MHAIMLKAKLHRAIVTHAVLDYEGSCAIDGEWLDLSGIREYEQIQSYNVDNGERFTTYAISAAPGSGCISVNGAAARRVALGDLLIIASYLQISPQEAQGWRPKVVHVDTQNREIRPTLAV